MKSSTVVISVIALLFSSSVALAVTDPCAEATAALADFARPLTQNCETKNDCVLLNERCLPLVVISKPNFDNASNKAKYEELRSARVSTCEAIVKEKGNCPRDLEVSCVKRTCYVKEVPLNSAKKK